MGLSTNAGTAPLSATATATAAFATARTSTERQWTHWTSTEPTAAAAYAYALDAADSAVYAFAAAPPQRVTTGDSTITQSLVCLNEFHYLHTPVSLYVCLFNY